jgi:hypothetical protein
MSETDREHLINNIAGHLSGAKSKEVVARQRKYSFIISCHSGPQRVFNSSFDSVCLRCCGPELQRPRREGDQRAHRPTAQSAPSFGSPRLQDQHRYEADLNVILRQLPELWDDAMPGFIMLMYDARGSMYTTTRKWIYLEVYCHNSDMT